MIIPPLSQQLAEPSIHPEQAVSTPFGMPFFGRPAEARNDVIRHPQFNQVDTVALGAHFSSSADQPLNCLAFVTDVKSVKELLSIEVEYKQPDGR
jgi:hypothetical protein